MAGNEWRNMTEYDGLEEFERDHVPLNPPKDGESYSFKLHYVNNLLKALEMDIHRQIDEAGTPEERSVLLDRKHRIWNAMTYYVDIIASNPNPS